MPMPLDWRRSSLQIQRLEEAGATHLCWCRCLPVLHLLPARYCRKRLLGCALMANPVGRSTLAFQIVGTSLLIVVCSGLLAASPASARKTKQELSAQLTEARRRFKRADVHLTQRGEPVTARQVTAGVISMFLPYVQEDLDHDELGRAETELGALRSLTRRLESSLSTKEPKVLVNGVSSEAQPEGSRLKVQGDTIVATLPDRTTRPVFLTGYGLVDDWRNDVEKLPTVGANVMQIEIGPDKLFPKADVFDRKPLDQLLGLLDRAAKVGVAVDVLLSPHYFPAWIFDRVPALRKRREGFVQYCIHHPAARELLLRHIRVVVDAIKEHPALLSVCLANEPQNIEEPCEIATREWHGWLKSRHGSVGEFNAAHDTHHRNFDEVALPSPYDPPRDRSLWLDYIRFNQEDHAAWLRLLADAVHEVAPGLPVHVKALTPLFTGRVQQPSVGLDPTLLARFSNLNGNDCGISFASIWSEFSQDWLDNAMGQDLQKSLNPAPTFNSETHLISDNEQRIIPPIHFRTALWQAAVHGQAASTIWLWARSTRKTSDTLRTVLERPDAIESIGRVNLDMNRAASELVALQEAPLDVAILYSMTSQVWDPQVRQETDALFTALSFMGLKIGFVTERQLEDGDKPSTSILFVPGMVHLSSHALSQLAGYTGRLVFVGGKELLVRDEHDRTTTVRFTAEVLNESARASWRSLWRDLKSALRRWAIEPAVTLRSPQGDPLWGIEWRSVHIADDSWLVNLVNYRKDALPVVMLQKGSRTRCRDVLTGLELQQPLLLGSLETKLVRMVGEVDRSKNPVRSSVDVRH